MADAALVLGPGLELGAALAMPGRLTVVADTLDVDGSWLLARMVAGALARDAGLAALLVFSEPGRWEQWAQALRKAVRRRWRECICCRQRGPPSLARRDGACWAFDSGGTNVAFWMLCQGVCLPGAQGLPAAAMERRIARAEVQEGELPAAAVMRQVDGSAGGERDDEPWSDGGASRLLVVVDDLGGAVDNVGRICGGEACAGIMRLLRDATAGAAATSADAGARAAPAVVGVCVRVRSELVPAAQSLGSRAMPADAAASAPAGDAFHQQGCEAMLWAAAGLVVSLGPLPSGSASGVTGILGAEVRDCALGPCLASALPFVVDEAGVRVGASVTA